MIVNIYLLIFLLLLDVIPVELLNSVLSNLILMAEQFFSYCHIFFCVCCVFLFFFFTLNIVRVLSLYIYFLPLTDLLVLATVEYDFVLRFQCQLTAFVVIKYAVHKGSFVVQVAIDHFIEIVSILILSPIAFVAVGIATYA